MKEIKYELEIDVKLVKKVKIFFEKYSFSILFMLLTIISITAFFYFYKNGLGVAYNDARSHLDISRRVVEGLKPGLAQLGSVWLPLPHILMLATIWNDFFWHSGLAGGVVSMLSYLGTGVFIYLYLKKLNMGKLSRWIGVLIFALNINVLYLQSTAMTESLLLFTTTASSYYLLAWFNEKRIADLIKCGFYLMLSTLTRYDGWFLFLITLGILGFYHVKKNGLKNTEGILIFFSTLAGLGILLWFLWNQLIFKDAFYFAFGPFSAHSQQLLLQKAGNLATKGDLFYSIKIYFYALFYNINTFIAIIGFVGFFYFLFNKSIDLKVKVAALTLTAPLLFNIIALYVGHSVLFIQGLSGNTWFNARYGIMVIPFTAIFVGYLIKRIDAARIVLIGLLTFTMIFSFLSFDAVTIDDAKVGSSQKNVSEVSGWLQKNASQKEGFVLISAASHDAIIFSSGMPMKRFIHEGTGKYWDEAIQNPDNYARWIIMRTNDQTDLTYKNVEKTPGFQRYNLIAKFPFADIYQIKDQYLGKLLTKHENIVSNNNSF